MCYCVWFSRHLLKSSVSSRGLQGNKVAPLRVACNQRNGQGKIRLGEPGPSGQTQTQVLTTFIILDLGGKNKVANCSIHHNKRSPVQIIHASRRSWSVGRLICVLALATKVRIKGCEASLPSRAQSRREVGGAGVWASPEALAWMPQ